MEDYSLCLSLSVPQEGVFYYLFIYFFPFDFFSKPVVEDKLNASCVSMTSFGL